jgi:2-polyprenyl-6-methoxyphenol hydroxylase-like FAD-dependent oxidoreductase
MANQPQTQPGQAQGAMFPPLVSLAPGRPPRPHPGTGQMVIIGDAADAPSPTSGQGASIAAEDAAILAK